MGVVYKARHLALDRLVALKMLLLGTHAGPDDLERFRTEAEAVARLRHSNIVQIHEVGECRGLPYFAMEFCPRGSLANGLDGTPWEAKPAARLIETLARAMHAAHTAGIVHRDLKPGNVLLASDGAPKVTDFGLARRLDVPGQTRTGAILGTPSYMPPEQAGGKGKEAGPAADVYSLGAILYELLTGRPPFKAATDLDTLLQVLADEPPAVRRLQPKVHRDLENVCHKCLDKDPRKRYATAEALAEDLRRFQAGEPVTARPVGLLRRAAKWARRRPAVAGLLTLVLLVIAAGATGILWAYREAVQQRDRAEGETERVRQEKQRADANADKARREAQEAKLQAYYAMIGRADAQLQAGDNKAAAGVLARVNEEFRGGWEYRHLARRTGGTPLALAGAYGPICYSPDGSRLATGSSDNSVRLWDSRTGEQVLVLRGHTKHITAMSYSPDGSRLATCSEDNSIRLWDPRTGRQGSVIRGRSDDSYPRSLCYSPDGTRLASGSWQGEVQVWDARTGQEIMVLEGYPGTVDAVCYSPDGTRLASGSQGGEVRVCDAGTGRQVLVLRDIGRVLSLGYSRDGTRLAVGTFDLTTRVLDGRTGAEVLTLRGHSRWVVWVCYSPDGSRIATTALDDTARVWDATTGAELFALHGARGWGCYSPDGSRLAAVSAIDNTVRVWDARSGQQGLVIRGHSEDLNAVCYSPDGRRLATASYDRTARVWDARTGRQELVLRGHTGGVLEVCYSPDGSRLATTAFVSNKPGEVRVWDAHSGREVLLVGCPKLSVPSACFSPDGSHLAIAVARVNPTVRVCEAATGIEVFALPGAHGPVRYSPDGSQLATGFVDHSVRIWETRTGQPVAELRGYMGDLSSMCYSPDGCRIATASGKVNQPGEVRVWDTHTAQELLALRGHTGPVMGVSYSPDGTRLATGSEDGTARIWDARTGQEVLVLRGHAHYVASVSFSPDGLRLATASYDTTVRVWDAHTGPPLLDQSPAPAETATPTGANADPALPQPSRPGDYDPWAEDWDRRQAFGADWHAADAAAAAGRGDWIAAVFHRQRLAQLHPGDWRNRRQLAYSYLRLGRGREAKDVFDQPLAADPRLAPAYLERARLLLVLGDRTKATADILAALVVASAVRAGWPEAARAEVEQGEQAAHAGDWRAAREHFGLAALWQPNEPEYRWRLAVAYLAHPGPQAHRRTLEPLLAGPHVVSDLEVPWRLSAVLAAGFPTSATPGTSTGLVGAEAALRQQAGRRADKAVQFAGSSSNVKMYAAAARLYSYAFAADATLAENFVNGYRYNAACVAALAACGQGKDADTLSPAAKVGLRQQAHIWLRADLDCWSKQVANGQGDGRAEVLRQMRHWRSDPNLASVRDKKALAALPQADRCLWEHLWADVAALTDRARIRR
jgi:WD40 repeat protein/tetratricopeptide (TPR) repeat protein